MRYIELFIITKKLKLAKGRSRKGGRKRNIRSGAAANAFKDVELVSSDWYSIGQALNRLGVD